jgi:hypothetical protein
VRRGVIWLSAVVAMGLPVAAFAGGLGPGGGGIAAGSGAVAACDTAFGQTYTTVAGNVTSVLVTGIADPTCEGGRLSLTLASASGSALGSGGPVTIPTDGDAVANSVSVPLSPSPDGDLVAAIRIVIAGP